MLRFYCLSSGRGGREGKKRKKRWMRFSKHREGKKKGEKRLGRFSRKRNEESETTFRPLGKEGGKRGRAIPSSYTLHRRG